MVPVDYRLEWHAHWFVQFWNVSLANSWATIIRNQVGMQFYEPFTALSLPIKY